ncbi:MAG: PD40 domain-containing protein [Planctomycetes bacterium]|nr:PD40 domain-containing protein [Planctomycetota bacterium]
MMHLIAIACLLTIQQPAESRPSSDAPWKIEDPHGSYKTVAFNTDEATWLHLDVSPDGATIILSILGDLYTMPSSGGKAARITSGAAYDAQPRFSPDGKWIAFASDRNGLENIWICDIEGKNARVISSEKGSSVSAPSWSPDGQYIIARKRLTDTSSLGTVELWMWHVRGGGGVQITKKDEQPDAADPVFSRDGRFIYFSARESRYKYSRNINEGIWQIKRFDRQGGQTIQLTSEYGGAAAPMVSPDGNSLAFTRRVRAKTRIETMDLASGATRVVAEDVERDMQEGFAFHGTFPGYNWTPDGKFIIATAEGKIWKFSVLGGARTPIPFSADVEQRVADAVRFNKKAANDDVRARILRWPVESPDSKKLVFSALGHLYHMPMPGGTPRRLTAQEDLEFCPSFSADGDKLTFVTFGEKSGAVWVANADGSSARQVTTIPAQYANPSFSADGKKIVFLKGSGATLRDDDPAAELYLEIHWIDAGGGASHYVTSVKNRGTNRRMSRPTFSNDGKRIYFIDDEPAGKAGEGEKTVLASIQIDGMDRRTHLRFSRAEEVTVSPDENWLMISELHNAYLAAFPRAGAQTVEINLDNCVVPIARLTDDGGEFVNFADGGKTLTWIYGPTYHRISMRDALPEPAASKEDTKDPKKDDKKPAALPKSDAIEIVLNVPRARPSRVAAYVNARIISMKGDEVIENGAIVVDGDRIRSVGRFDPPSVPAGAEIVDCAGATIMPGMFDEHAHLHYSTSDILTKRPWKYLANLAYGVTSTHDPSASSHEVFTQAEMVEAGFMVGPRIFSTGFILYGADTPGRAIVNNLDDARKHLRRMKALGAFSVKSYMQPKREQRQWILQAAREEQMMVVPEGGGDLESNMSMILDGHTTIEHALPVAPLHKDVVELFAKSGTSYTPTLLVAYGGLWGELWYYQHDEVWKNERLLKYVPQGVVDGKARIRAVMATDEDWHHIDVAAGAKKIVDAGGRVCMGGHGQMQGLGPHWEMWTMVQGGMTPLQAIRASTLAPAQTLGLDGDLGSIEIGKLADFIILEKNPMEQIRNSETVKSVVKNGVLYNLKDLERR